MSFASGVLFVVAEVIFALLSNSQSALMDGAMDATDLVVIILTLFLAPLFRSPISEKRPFGYAQVESLFITVKSIMMLSVMLGLSANVVQTSLAGGARVDYGSVSLFQLILGLISLGILAVMYRWNRTDPTPTAWAEVLGWRLDVTYSLGLSAAFFLAQMLEKTVLGWLSPYFDQIVALLVVAFALPDAIRLLRQSVHDLFLFSPDEETTEQIKTACAPVLEHFAFRPVFYDIIRTGRRMWVGIYFEIEGDALPMDHLRQASAQLEQILSAMLENCTCELIPATRENTTCVNLEEA